MVEGKNKYEAVVVLHPEFPEDQIKSFFKQIKTTITSFKGSLHHVDHLGSRSLPNLGKLKGVKVASFFHFSYEALPGCVADVERLFRIQESVLYFHHEKLDSRLTLDKHQEHFERILEDSAKREAQRVAFFKNKKKKTTGGISSSEARG